MSLTSKSFGGPFAVRGRRASPLTAARSFFQGRRGLYAVALTLAAAALAIGGAWWGFAAILPLLSVLPCAAMMAMCMRGHGNPGQNVDAKPAPSETPIGEGATDEVGPR